MLNVLLFAPLMYVINNSFLLHSGIFLVLWIQTSEIQISFLQYFYFLTDFEKFKHSTSSLCVFFLFFFDLKTWKKFVTSSKSAMSYCPHANMNCLNITKLETKTLARRLYVSYYTAF